MNIFEDLIDELKQENLLEQTVTESNKTENDDRNEKNGEPAAEVSPENFAVELDAPLPIEERSPNNQVFTPSEPTKNKAEFFRKRATEEVAGLQMVEHIFSGVERQQKKLMPKIYDDLNVKKALHAFLQVSDTGAPEHAQAEFQLMQETESWYSALSHRDKQISVAHLRRYCETTRPALSAQALVALARFYRNSPYSEAVRSKFDLIVTRLFSKESGGEKREIVFQKDELMRHLSDLYADWESVSVYSSGTEEEDESELLLTAFKFEEFITEAEDAVNFDELIKNDFFNRLRSFKQGTSERFFAPVVTATAIESNIRVGNRYIVLLELEKEKGELDKLENKYGFLHDQVISDATSKTLQLVELLKQKDELPTAEEVETEREATKIETVSVKIAPEKIAPKSKSRASFFGINKWLLIGAAIAIVLSVGIYLWSAMNAPTEKLSTDVRAVSLNNSALNELIKDGRIGNHTFFAITQPTWDTLSREKKEETLKRIMDAGAEKDFKSVRLISPNGKIVGSVAEGVVEVF